MTTISYSDLRARLASFLDRADEDCEEIVVHRGRGKADVIFVSLHEFESIKETAYLLSSPKNRKHLEKSLKEARGGKTVKVKL